MKCNICGAEMDSGDRICKYCGNELNMTYISEKSAANASVETEASEVMMWEQSIPVSENQNHYCARCGKVLDKTNGECVFCERINFNLPTKQNEVTEENVMTNKRSRRKRKKGNRAVFIVVLLVVLAVLFGLSYWYFFNLLDGVLNGEKPTPAPTPTIEVTDDVEQVNTTEAVTAVPANEGEDEDEGEAVTGEPPQSDPEAVVNYHGGEYLFPSYEKVISEKELMGMERSEIKLTLQEIYARYGYTFEDDDLIEYFESQNWYMPTTTDIDKVESMFNKYEKENVEVIEAYQRKMGWRK